MRTLTPRFEKLTIRSRRRAARLLLRQRSLHCARLVALRQHSLRCAREGDASSLDARKHAGRFTIHKREAPSYFRMQTGESRAKGAFVIGCT